MQVMSETHSRFGLSAVEVPVDQVRRLTVAGLDRDGDEPARPAAISIEFGHRCRGPG
jgi:hypothetical protein